MRGFPLRGLLGKRFTGGTVLNMSLGRVLVVEEAVALSAIQYQRSEPFYQCHRATTGQLFICFLVFSCHCPGVLIVSFMWRPVSPFRVPQLVLHAVHMTTLAPPTHHQSYSSDRIDKSCPPQMGSSDGDKERENTLEVDFGWSLACKPQTEGVCVQTYL